MTRPGIEPRSPRPFLWCIIFCFLPLPSTKYFLRNLPFSPFFSCLLPYCHLYLFSLSSLFFHASFPFLPYVHFYLHFISILPCILLFSSAHHSLFSSLSFPTSFVLLFPFFLTFFSFLPSIIPCFLSFSSLRPFLLSFLSFLTFFLCSYSLFLKNHNPLQMVVYFFSLFQGTTHTWNHSANFKQDASILTYSTTRGVMVIVVGNGHGDSSSNPGREWLHFT